jgi:prevent-host-death family protein
MTAPTEIFNVHVAKTQLSRLLERAEAGEEIVIGRAGKPIAKLVRYAPDRPRRVFGALRGQIRILPGFDALDDQIAQDFEDSANRPL